MKRFVLKVSSCLRIGLKCELATKHPHVTPSIIFREFPSTKQFRKNSETNLFFKKDVMFYAIIGLKRILFFQN